MLREEGDEGFCRNAEEGVVAVVRTGGCQYRASGSVDASISRTEALAPAPRPPGTEPKGSPYQRPVGRYPVRGFVAGGDVHLGQVSGGGVAGARGFALLEIHDEEAEEEEQWRM